MLHFFCVALFSGCTFLCCILFMLHFFCVALFSGCTFFVLHSFHVVLFFMLHLFHVALFSVAIFPCCTFLCCTIFRLYLLHVALSSYCTIFMLYFFFRVTLFHVALLHVAIFLLLSICILLLLHSQDIPLLLHFVYVVLFPDLQAGPPLTSQMKSFATIIRKAAKCCCKAFRLRCSLESWLRRVALFSCCTFSLSHFFFVALFSFCTFLILKTLK